MRGDGRVLPMESSLLPPASTPPPSRPPVMRREERRKRREGAKGGKCEEGLRRTGERETLLDVYALVVHFGVVQAVIQVLTLRAVVPAATRRRYTL